MVIPASWGIGAVREFRRNPRFRAVPLVILRGNKEFAVDALVELLEKPAKNLRVLPGGRSDRGQSLALHSALYIVCPSRPGQAGEVAARLARDIDNCALVCAAPESTGALALWIPKDNLICSDWRIPGSDAPLEWGGVTVWPVDPFKFLNVKDVSAHALVEQIKPKFNLVVVDCAGNLEIASRAPKTDGVIVLHKEGDAADAATSYWLKNYAGNNVFVMSPSEVPDVMGAESGFMGTKITEKIVVESLERRRAIKKEAVPKEQYLQWGQSYLSRGGRRCRDRESSFLYPAGDFRFQEFKPVARASW